MSLKNQFFILVLGVSFGLFSLPSHSQNTVLHAQVSGQGQPVVLIPGLMSDERVWQQTEAALAQHYEVHTLAFAGFGAHPSNPQLREAFTENAGAALERYLQENTAGDAVVIGHSLGAFLGYQLAGQQPLALECLIAVDGVPFFSALVSGNSPPNKWRCKCKWGRHGKPHLRRIKRAWSRWQKRRILPRWAARCMS